MCVCVLKVVWSHAGSLVEYVSLGSLLSTNKADGTWHLKRLYIQEQPVFPEIRSLLTAGTTEEMFHKKMVYNMFCT